MPKAYRLGDLCTGHDSRIPTPAMEASEDVFVNGMGAVRLGDAITPHGCFNNDPTKRVISTASGTVFVNGKPVARSGDAISCGGFAEAGSDNVEIGG